MLIEESFDRDILPSTEEILASTYHCDIDTKNTRTWHLMKKITRTCICWICRWATSIISRNLSYISSVSFSSWISECSSRECRFELSSKCIIDHITDITTCCRSSTCSSNKRLKIDSASCRIWNTIPIFIDRWRIDRITTISYYIWWCIRSEEWADRFSSKKILECRWAIIFLSTIFNVFWEYDHIDLPNIRDDIIVRVCRISIHIEPKWWEFFYIALFISSSSFSFLIFCSETEYEFMILVSGGIFYSILFEYFCKFSIIPIWYFFECLDFSRGIFYPTTFDTFCTKFIECWFFCEAFWENFRSYLIISCVDRRIEICSWIFSDISSFCSHKKWGKSQERNARDDAKTIHITIVSKSSQKSKICTSENIYIIRQ